MSSLFTKSWTVVTALFHYEFYSILRKIDFHLITKFLFVRVLSSMETNFYDIHFELIFSLSSIHLNGFGYDTFKMIAHFSLQARRLSIFCFFLFRFVEPKGIQTLKFLESIKHSFFSVVVVVVDILGRISR